MIDKGNMVVEYNGIIIDNSRNNIIPEKGLAMLTAKGFYKKDHEDSPQQIRNPLYKVEQSNLC